MIASGIAVMVTGLALLVVSDWLSAPSIVMFLGGGLVTGAGAGALFKGVVAMVALDAPADRRAEALAGMFLAGYIGLSLPVVALGVMTQYLSLRVSLLIFTGALAAGIAAVTPRLLAGDPRDKLAEPERRVHTLRTAAQRHLADRRAA